MPRTLSVFVLFGLLFAGVCFAQAKAINPDAQRFINAGNQAWVKGMKTGDVSGIAATYAKNALDCGPTGECDKGRAAIESAMKARIAKLGDAVTASVTSSGAVQRGELIYEWGYAAASFAGGREIRGPYLTVWQLQGDGSWKIFRNMALPASSAK